MFKNPIIFVGSNDSGKSSIFKVLDVFFNNLTIGDNNEIFLENRFRDYLMPKYSDQYHSSKRIMVELGARDGRSLRGMTGRRCNTATLILTITRNKAKLELNQAHRGVSSDPKAIRLYKRMKDEIFFTHIPSLRDVSSDVFKANLLELFKKNIFDQINPKQAGGTTAAYRAAKGFVDQYKDNLRAIANSELLSNIKENIPIKVSDDIEFDVDVDVAEIFKTSLEWIKFIRPAREGEPIPMQDIGTGLLSSLSLAVLLANKILPHKDKVNLIAIEEPEAFVHPHYQRSLFSRLLSNAGKSNLLISTHSPAIIDRERVGNIAIVTRESPQKGSKVWQVGDIPDVDEEIFSDHANFENSELFFSDLVIFVEGPSEKLVLTYLFDKLPEGIKELFFGISIVEVGGNAHYGPFIRLMKSFSRTGKEFPIKWLIFTDKDSIRPGNNPPVIRALKDTGYNNVEYEQINTILSKSFKDHVDGLQKIRSINDKLKLARCFVNLADLEYSLLTPTNFKEVYTGWMKEKEKNLISGDLPANVDDALSYIGSKGLNCDGDPSKTGKRPFIHGKIMKWTSLGNISEILQDFVKVVAGELTDKTEELQKLAKIWNS